MMMSRIEAGAGMAALQWYAVRVKGGRSGGMRRATVGGDFETYISRAGQARVRRIAGTGKSVFLPEHRMLKAGFEVFLPVQKKLRRVSPHKPEKAWFAYPLIADWIFVGWPVFEDRWPDLMALDLVTGVAGTGGRPVRVSASEVQRLMRQWGGGELSASCVRYLKADQIAVGDDVDVVAGPMAGVAGAKVVGVENGLVSALVEFFGREMRVKFQSVDVKKAD